MNYPRLAGWTGIREAVALRWQRLRGARRLPPDRLTLAQAEARIRHRLFETAYVFDRSGRQLFRQTGGADYVFFRSADVPLFKDALILHNHPPDWRFPPTDPRHAPGSFSRHDVTLAVEYDVAELRVVTAEWRDVAIRPPGGWPVDSDSLSAIYQETRADVDEEVTQAITGGNLAPEYAKAWGWIADEVVQRVARQVGFAYRRERLSRTGHDRDA